MFTASRALSSRKRRIVSDTTVKKERSLHCRRREKAGVMRKRVSWGKRKDRFPGGIRTGWS